MKYDLDIDLSSNTSHSLILKRINPNSRVLEFGSATGYMTRYMKEKLKCEVVCIEIDEVAALKAERYSSKMIVADIDELSWEKHLEGKFDYILFADVLEHLRSPKKVLAVARKFLSENGSVITSIPNISHNSIIMELMEGKFNYQNVGLLDETHIHFFTRESVLSLLEECDLEPVEWLTTMRKPETTEFKQNYTRFPVQIQNFLRGRLDGEVYQFVTVSKKSSLEEKISNFNLVQYENYLDKDFCQIYWDENGIFSEECSLILPIKTEGARASFKFTIPSGNWESIRIDPSNAIVYGEIENIKLTSVETGFEIKELIEGLQTTNNVERLQGKDVCRFISLSNDPQLILSNIALLKNSSYYLEFDMKILNNTGDIYREFIKDLNVYESLQLDNKLLNDQYNTINTTLIEKNQEIESYKIHIMQLSKNNQYLLNENEKYSKVILQRESELKMNYEKLDNSNKELERIYNSLLWKLTSPIRIISEKIRHKEQ